MRALGLLLCTLALPVAAQTPAAAAAATPAPAAEPRPVLLPFGSVAPDVAGVILNGAPDTKLSDYRGRVVVVDFWATWCAPCLLSMPQLNQMREDMARLGWGDRFEIVGINTDSDLAKARRFLELNPVKYPIIGDPIGIAMKRFGPWKLPATFLLTPEGKVHMIWLGYADNFVADIQHTAVELLRQGGPPSPPASAAP